jgi:nucleotide-binding universal stress UspA family protein
MMRIKTILCPIDFGPAAVRATNYAASFAGMYGAKVHLLHVVTPPPTGEYEYATTRAEIIKSIEEASFLEMKTAAEKLEAKGIAVQIDMRTGDVHETIKQHISFVQPDFIVMGTHGRHGITRWFMGSLTESLMRNSPVPLLTISPQMKSEPAFRRILVTTDFSSGTADALDYAYCIAQDNGSEITLLHVIDTNMALSIKYGNFLMEVARTALEHLSPPDVRNGCNVSTEVQEGSPYQVILRTLQRVKPDLLVMNIHAKGILDRALHRNTAERVVRTAPCPVMLIPRMKVKASPGCQAA